MCQAFSWQFITSFLQSPEGDLRSHSAAEETKFESWLQSEARSVCCFVLQMPLKTIPGPSPRWSPQDLADCGLGSWRIYQDLGRYLPYLSCRDLASHMLPGNSKCLHDSEDHSPLLHISETGQYTGKNQTLENLPDISQTCFQAMQISLVEPHL